MLNPRFALFVRHVDLGYWRFTGSYKWLSQSYREGCRVMRNEGDKFYVLDMETQLIVANENGIDLEIWNKSKDISS